MKQDTSRAWSRRDLLALPGAGLLVFFPVGQLPAFQRRGFATDFNAYLHIGENGRVTCLVGKVELGQGPMTALAQILAEELDVELDSVDTVMGDTDVCPWDMGTFGSLSVRQYGPLVRGAAAEARAVLVSMAAERLGVPVDSLRVQSGVITSTADSGRVTYAELVQGQRIERHLENVSPKPVSSYTIVGQSPRRKDALEKVTGKAKYAGDMELPGTLHARILRPPAHDAKLIEVDTSAAEKVEGVRVVRDGGLIAFLHERPDIADDALRLARAKYERPGATYDDETVFEHILKAAPAPQVVYESGSLAEGEKLADSLIEETYLNSYVAHAPMETHSAVARIENGKATVWAGTQTPFTLQQEVAQALGFSQGDVRVITPYVGGGFGGKSASNQAVEAARLAKITGRPVQVVWDRAEEFFYDTFRPAAVVKVRSGLTADGKIPLWDFQVFGAGDREARQFYDIPNQRTVSAGGWSGGNPPGMHPFEVGPWRAPSVNTNTFARESQIDILASKAGVDPLEFRLRHLTDERPRRVLEAAAKQFGWQAGKSPSGRGVGVSCATDVDTWVAMMAEVEVDRASGHVQVKRVVCAQDQGLIISPDGTRQQIEGCIMMGLGYTLSEEVRFRGGEVLDRNFDTYHLPRFSWMPRIESVLIGRPETAAAGSGEPGIVNVGAVVANAICDAVGVRLFQLPMTPARVLKALEAA